ncbi:MULTISPECIES: enoyl-CoA hydratase/isomerase family protein [unclassified Sphingobium]|uniref:enoyl-CoA hydratase/isomerase family protein n=1 Tax=unclassified Sphingobium TaxID=2611147 RepID=UPI000D17209D|nr:MULTISPECIES: enoyl-CoA hydratase/isomerase family protein [unclassified Sphingobium]MBG6120083.1 enoyl-CoA hydratase/carnithine racemase [Sphingobium sp. JAI105]PSO12868.1 oxidoreductase [Sphingobium sp. AEW4]TWD05716.1 enoyl-CoA hydratase [Sphingobium sp. AEW010]TWD23269.1 enoyl-CoA hydratase [Sphingobium sp. AEW013]TWD25129.1 enoyl-CoA hydratase [Sphingobium sp. AEW001]
MGVRTERHGAAAVAILDWPEQRNAMGPDECRELSAALAGIADDPSVLGVVITGEGAFCAGGNIRGAKSRIDMSPEERRTVVYSAYQGMIRSIIDIPVPTVAAIDGAAVGMGLDIALACDSRFFGPRGWCMQGWGRVGLIPGTGGEWLLRLTAPGLLWRLLEEQERIYGEAAARLGLGEVAGEEGARARALARIEKLSAMGRPALEGYAALYRGDLRAGIESHLTAAVDRQIALLQSARFGEKVDAALGKS